ncbi:MAG: alpha-glucan family phosphorylase [Desulfobacterales bacterium]|nr:alpha-glucan family phosphorylase [Desulfobacterales bacterium]
MRPIQSFQVYPDIPDSLRFIEILSRNMWWSWQRDAIDIYRRVDPMLWEKAGRNPLYLSTFMKQDRLVEISKDRSFLAHLSRIKEQYEHQIADVIDFSQTPYGSSNAIAYFSMEFGIHESLPIFAGGLGILAGDHLKAASDMKVPLVGVGLLYRHGYFRQFLSNDGWQQEDYPETDLYHLPVFKAKNQADEEVFVTVDCPQGKITAAVWKILIGRVSLYLLDTNIPENPPEIREITSKLYLSEPRTRIAQEVLLGIGGLKALAQMGIIPSVIHMNEGHCSFSVLERVAQIMEKYNVDLKTALEIVPRINVFTTHTPVPAGHDEFPVDLVRPCIAPYESRLGIPMKELMSWGQHPGSGEHSPFCMFILGVKLAHFCNGVSKLHGDVARKMWLHLWPNRPVDEIPITHVTNGVHVPSWISHENSQLFDRYLGPEWHFKLNDEDTINRIDDIYDEELWRAHEMSRARLIRTCRKMMLKQYGRRNAPKEMMIEAESVLDQDVLTIAFARRFATYKRANLLLQDPERFERIITSEKYPVQFVFSGKAHPRDNEGKELIKRLIQFARKPSLRHRIVFIEDYDIHMARHLVHGADIWLNTPRRPNEACGTSGMKAAINGVLNVSILDGWWCEGYNADTGTGWAIGAGEDYFDSGYQDSVESQALYNILENEIIPCFYERQTGDAPHRWLKMMKASMKMGILDFCSTRMVSDYEKRFYLPAIENLNRLVKDNAAEAKHLCQQHHRLQELWKDIRIEPPVRESDGTARVGACLKISSGVHLGRLRPDEVEVQLYYGRLKSVDAFESSATEIMTVSEDRGNGYYIYSCNLSCNFPGRVGFTVRAIPKGDEVTQTMAGFMAWNN